MIEQELKVASKPVSLWLAIIFSFASFLVSFGLIVSSHGVTSSNYIVLFDHAGAFFEFIAEAIGFSFGLPLIHVGIASCFKSKRNKNTRRYIFIGWGIAIIIINIISQK
jgi:hypothetical protein